MEGAPREAKYREDLYKMARNCLSQCLIITTAMEKGEDNAAAAKKTLVGWRVARGKGGGVKE